MNIKTTKFNVKSEISEDKPYDHLRQELPVRVQFYGTCGMWHREKFLCLKSYQYLIEINILYLDANSTKEFRQMG